MSIQIKLARSMGAKGRGMGGRGEGGGGLGQFWFGALDVSTEYC